MLKLIKILTWRWETKECKELSEENGIKAILCHCGETIHNGHYIIYIRELYESAETDTWYKCDDHVITRFDFSKVKTEVLKTSYLVLYTKKTLERKDRHSFEHNIKQTVFR